MNPAKHRKYACCVAAALRDSSPLSLVLRPRAAAFMMLVAMSPALVVERLTGAAVLAILLRTRRGR